MIELFLIEKLGFKCGFSRFKDWLHAVGETDTNKVNSTLES